MSFSLLFSSEVYGLMNTQVKNGMLPTVESHMRKIYLSMLIFLLFGRYELNNIYISRAAEREKERERRKRDVRTLMITFAGNGHGNSSSNPGRVCLHFTSH